MVITMAMFTGEYAIINTITFTLLSIAIYLLICKIIQNKKRNKKTDKEISKNISIGFYLGVTNILILMIGLYFINYII